MKFVAAIGGFVLALPPLLLFVSGATNAQFRDCWGNSREERRRWWWASMGRMLLAAALLGLEVAVLLWLGRDTPRTLG